MGRRGRRRELQRTRCLAHDRPPGSAYLTGDWRLAIGNSSPDRMGDPLPSWEIIALYCRMAVWPWRLRPSGTWTSSSEHCHPSSPGGLEKCAWVSLENRWATGHAVSYRLCADWVFLSTRYCTRLVEDGMPSALHITSPSARIYIVLYLTPSHAVMVRWRGWVGI